MQGLRANVRRFLERQRGAARIPPVLLLGETGTGKSRLAKLLHRGSPRAEAPFIDVNCAAIPESLLESELFGFERGAFTDARHAKAGLFQAAHRGTIFLDEIALMSDVLQGKLLKVLEDRAVRRLGSTRTEPVDVWVIAATSEDLRAKARDGGFREDLYHRLAVITWTLPPLRNRRDDVLLLADALLRAACADYGLPPKSLGPDARRALAQYGWPGNVRELANAMERVALLCEADDVRPEHLALPLGVAGLEVVAGSGAEGGVDARRRDELLAALTQTNWNISRAAAQLLITRNTIRARIRKYGLRDPNPAPDRRASGAPERPAPPVPASRAERAATRADVVWESRRVTLLRVELSAPTGDAFTPAARHALETVVDKVRSFQGRVEEVTPTGMLAVFGLEPVDEGPRRAANAALAIHRALSRAADEPVAVSLALHFAEVLVARIEGGLEIDARSKREAWTLLDSLGSQAKLDGVVVSPAAAGLLHRRFELAPLAGVNGRAGAAQRLVGPERRTFLPAGHIAAFTGRHYELDVLRRRLAAAVGGRRQVLGVAGEPGIGKSRLLHEFRRTLDDGYRVVTAECAAHGRSFSYFAVVELLRGLLGVNDGDDPRIVRDTVTWKFPSFRGAEPSDGVAALLGLLGCLPPDDPLFSLTPAQRRRRTLEALQGLLVAESERRPLVLIVEDLQWVDPESEAVFRFLIERVQTARLLLLSSYRTEYSPPWAGKGDVLELNLEPLSPTSVHAVLEDLLGGDPPLARLKELIVQRTEGNPLFVEETVRGLIETRIVVGSRGSYELAEAIDAIDVPPTIQAVLGTRIDRLGPDERRLLQAAAVIGRRVPLALLSTVADIPERDAVLAALQRARFLGTLPEAPEPTYLFTHALTCEVAHASLLAEERRRLHARVVSALEATYSEALLDQVDTLAHHAYESELWEKAASYYREAAQKAMSRSAYRAAVLCLERARSAISKLPPTPETLAAAVDVRFELRNALWALGELSRGLECLREAAPLVEALGDRHRLAKLFARTSFNALIMGDNDGALEAGERALALANDVHDTAVQIDAHQYLGVLYNSLGDYRRAIQNLEWILRGVAASNPPSRFADYYAVHSRTWLVWALCELGELERATALAGEAATIAEASRQPFNVVASKWAHGMLELARGRPAPAVAVLREALSACQAADVAIWLRPTVALLGRALSRAGRLTEARPLLEQAMRDDENHVGVSAWQTYLAEGYMLDGRLDDAWTQAQQAAERARERKEHGFLAHAHRQLAEIAALQGSPEQARSHFAEALDLARERGMTPLIADCEAGLAKLDASA